MILFGAVLRLLGKPIRNGARREKNLRNYFIFFSWYKNKKLAREWREKKEMYTYYELKK